MRAGGWLPRRRSRDRPRFRRRLPVAAQLIAGLALLVALGAGLLMLSGLGSARALSFGDALFTSVSALSVTGLARITPARDLSLAGQIVLLLLIQVGGVGFMAFAVIVLRLIGRKVTLYDRLALRDSLGLVVPGAIVKIARRVFVTAVAVEGAGAVLLWLHWRAWLGDARAALYAVFHAVSAYCNAGFELFTGADGWSSGIPSDGFSLLVLGGLIFLGGLGIPVIADMLAWPRHRRVSLHTRLTLLVSVALFAAGTAGIFLAESGPGQLLSSEPVDRQIGLAMFHAVSARTAGIIAVDSFGQMAPATQLVFVVLMFIGCAPASMGGGITTGAFVTLWLAIWSYARGQSEPQAGRRTLSRGKVIRAGVVLSLSLFVVVTATWLILITHAVTLDQALFEVVSAFATCGLTLDFTGRLNPFGQAVIMAVMFWGRLGALTVIAALAQQRPPSLVAYPTEDILIG